MSAARAGAAVAAASVAVPTARSVTWSPLGSTAVCAAGVAAVCALAGEAPNPVVALLAAGFAAAAVAGLGDPAADLLAASPVPPGRRRLYRLGAVVPATLLTWLAVAAALRAGVPTWSAGWYVGPLLALLTAGAAAATWLPDAVRVSGGAAVPLLWFLGGVLLPSPTGLVEDVALGWQAHPWIVVAAGSTLVLLGRNR